MTSQEKSKSNCLCILAQALVISTLDYCNSVLYGLPGLVLGLVSSIEQHFHRNSILFVCFVAEFTAALAPRI